MGVSVPAPTPEHLRALVPQVLARPASMSSPYASDGRAAGRVAGVVLGALARDGDIASKSADAFQ
jgi:hypothetical protein